MEESILNSIKKLLGIASDYTNFDSDILMHINTAFMTLSQIGIGPSNGFAIKDNTAIWKDYVIPEDNLESIKTYIYLKVKIVFDPPLNSSVMESMKQVINELEWRLNVQAETNVANPPINKNPESIPDDYIGKLN